MNKRDKRLAELIEAYEYAKEYHSWWSNSRSLEELNRTKQELEEYQREQEG
jgi:hypothetical protein